MISYPATRTIMNEASYDYCEISDANSSTHVATTSTGDYHVLEEPSKGCAPHVLTQPVTGGDNSPGTNVSAYEVPTTTPQKVA